MSTLRKIPTGLQRSCETNRVDANESPDSPFKTPPSTPPELKGKNLQNRETINWDSQDARFQIYSMIYKGNQVSQSDMFIKPGYRGVQILPYPKHVRQMVGSSKDKFYQGTAIEDKRDIFRAFFGTDDSRASVKRQLKKSPAKRRISKRGGSMYDKELDSLTKVNNQVM